MIKIRILEASEGMHYTNEDISGKVIWLDDNEDISNWREVPDNTVTPTFEEEEEDKQSIFEFINFEE